MEQYERFINSRPASAALVSEMAETFTVGESSSFNFWPMLKFAGIADITKTISNHFFGIFAGFDQVLYPFLTFYGAYGVICLMLRTALAVVRVVKEHGLKPGKILLALFDPILYLMWLPFTLNSHGRDDNNRDDNNRDEPHVAAVPNVQIAFAPNAPPLPPNHAIGLAHNVAVNAELVAPPPAFYPAM